MKWWWNNYCEQINLITIINSRPKCKIATFSIAVTTVSLQPDKFKLFGEELWILTCGRQLCKYIETWETHNTQKTLSYRLWNQNVLLHKLHLKLETEAALSAVPCL